MSVPTSGYLTPAERSKRSILVGNIPGDTTQDQLRHLFFEFGPVLDFKFFNDNTGTQIGYAFCEYENPEIAFRAIHQLNNAQFRGQILKVDSAANDKSPEELESFLQGKDIGAENKNASGIDATTEKAPEEISKAVASLPPEQMFELMKQMKMCIENNPHEARNLLLQNPQLAFALLQAQVIMRIVDPEVALKILDRPLPVNVPEDTDANGAPNPNAEPVSVVNNVAGAPVFPAGMAMLANMSPAVSQPNNILAGANMGSTPVGIAANAIADNKNFPGDQDMRQFFRDSDMRNFNNPNIDPRMLQNMRMQDPRAMQVPAPDPKAMVGTDPRAMTVPDPRAMQTPDPRGMKISDPRAMQAPDPRAMNIPDPRAMQVPDPRAMQATDPRAMQIPDPRAVQVPDPRAIQAPDPRAMQIPDPRAMTISDPRAIQVPGARGVPDPRAMPVPDPRLQDPRMVQSQDPRRMPATDPRMMQGPNAKVGEGKLGPGLDPRADPRMNTAPDPRMLAGDPRMRQGADPRLKQGVDDPRKIVTSDGVPMTAPRMAAGTRTPAVTTSASGMPGLSLSGASDLPPEQEKAALIMQVLQLSDEQIAMLPPDQRQSILILKEQIARSHVS